MCLQFWFLYDLCQEFYLLGLNRYPFTGTCVQQILQYNININITYYTSILIAYNQCMQSQKICQFNVLSVVGLLEGSFDSSTVRQSARVIEEFSGCQQFVGCILDIVKDRRVDIRVKQAALVTLSNIIKEHNAKSDIIEVQCTTSQKQTNNNQQIIKTIKQNIITIAYQYTDYIQVPLIVNIIVELTKNMSKIQLKQIVQQIRINGSVNNQAICQDRFQGRYYKQFVYYSIIEGLVQLYNSSITEFYKSIIIVSITFTQLIQILTADLQRIKQCIQTNQNSQISMIIRNINCGLRVILLIFNKLNKLYEIIKKYIHQLLLILLYLVGNIDKIMIQYNQQLCESNTKKVDLCIELLHLNLSIIYRFYQFCYHYATDIKQQSTINQNALTLSGIIQSEYSKLVIVNIGGIILSDISLHIHISNQINLCNDITKCLYWITQVHAQTKSIILSNSVNILMALLKNYTIDYCDRQLCQISYRVEIDESRQGLLQLIGAFVKQQDNKIIVQQIIKTVSLQTNSNIQNIQLSMYIISILQKKQINLHIQDIISKNITPIICLKIDYNLSEYPELLGLLKIRACEIVAKYMNQIEQIGAVSMMHQLFLSNTLAILNQILTKNSTNNNLLQILLSYTSVLLSTTKIMKKTEQTDKNSVYKQLIAKLLNILPLLEHSESYNCVLDTLEQFLTCLHYACIRQILGHVFNSIFHIYWKQIQQLHEQLAETSQNNSKLIDREVEKDTKVIHEQCNDILKTILHLLLNQSKINKNSIQINYNVKWIVQLVSILANQSRIQIVKQCGQVQYYTLLFNQAVYLLLLACIYNGNANHVQFFDLHNVLVLCFDVIKDSSESFHSVEYKQSEQMHEYGEGEGQDNGLGQQFIFDGMEQQTQNKIIPVKISHKRISTILSTLSNTILLNYLIQKQSNVAHKSIQLSTTFKQIIFYSNNLTFKSSINSDYTYQQKKICLDTVKIFLWSQIFSHQIVCSLYDWALEQLLLQKAKKNQIQQYYLPIVYLSVIRYKNVIKDMSKLCQVLLNNLKNNYQAGNSTKYHQKWLIQCNVFVIKMIFSSNIESYKGIAMEILKNIQNFLSDQIENRKKPIQIHGELYTMNMTTTKNKKITKNTNYFTSQIIQQIICPDQAVLKYFNETLLQIRHIANNYHM